MSIHPDDLALVGRIVAGDHKAAEEFERKFMAKFEGIARHSGVSSQDCRDVAQEAFMSAISQMQRGLFRGDSSLHTWLVTILWGKISDYRRAQRRTGGLLHTSDSVDIDNISVIDQIASRTIDYALVTAVREALKGMPGQLRMILLLNRTMGFTIEEISKGMGLTKGQISGRLYKAEELFRQLIGCGDDQKTTVASKTLAGEDQHG
jgi:RNA polymerase sigma-70 factor, ECF subfamily